MRTTNKTNFESTNMVTEIGKYFRDRITNVLHKQLKLKKHKQYS